MMNKPVISKDFTIEDIHKIREFNAARRARLGKHEYNKDLNRKIAEFLNIGPNEILNKSNKKNAMYN